MADRQPTWRFAPNLGGAEQGNNPGQMHFRRALASMVRETLQNSLDHHEDGLPPVEVSYQFMNISPSSVGARQLADHAEACLKEARDEPQARERFRRMTEVLRGGSVPCLAIIDSNTTGLQGGNWENLVLREGVATRREGETKGGSFGFGKNAPFNLAAAGAVIYSTRYLDRRKGKVERMIGRAQLRTHTSPQGDRSQGTGFLALHCEEEADWNRPVQRPHIPGEFLLRDRGTAVFILGFDRTEHPGWERRVIQTTMEGFFPAVMWKQLVVRAGDQTLDHQTLPEEVQALGERDQTRHYHQALGQEPRKTTPSGNMFGRINGLEVRISADEKAPRRLAHVNRRGMLITQSRERADNPLYPRGGTGWQPWCAVTMAADEGTEQYLRDMEPPAHDAIQYAQLPGQER